MNIDTLKSDRVSQYYLNIFASANFSNVITILTRIKSCIDHINIYFNNKVVTSGTIMTKVADHLPTFISFECDSIHILNLPKTSQVKTIDLLIQKLFERTE